MTDQAPAGRGPTKLHVHEVVRVLRSAPDGMTTTELAQKFNANIDSVSARLSKLADYGLVDRAYEHRPPPTYGRRICRWRAA